MTEWTAKRFWTNTSVVAAQAGFGVELDGRPVKTPAKADLIVPTQALANQIAAEWDAQDGAIDPTTMPFTRTANAAIDKVAVQHSEVAEMLAAYGDSDLLCYRADHPQPLIDRQAEAWDPYLDWAEHIFGGRLKPVSGVMHAPQDEAVLKPMSQRTHAMTPFELAAFHDLVSLSGSLVLGFAVALNHAEPEAVWAASRVDEIWQEDHWGVDEEAAAAAAVKKAAFFHAAEFYASVQS